MKTMDIVNVSEYLNWGMATEQSLAYALTGEMRKHDSVPYDKGSDIPEYCMSVKSAHFSLVSGNRMHSETFDGQIEEFFKNVHSTQFAYVTKSCKVYIMDTNEFKMFVNNFCTLTRESKKNGGKAKIQMRSESKAVLEWFASMAA